MTAMTKVRLKKRLTKVKAATEAVNDTPRWVHTDATVTPVIDKARRLELCLLAADIAETVATKTRQGYERCFLRRAVEIHLGIL
jgi:hypothetical protein